MSAKRQPWSLEAGQPAFELAEQALAKWLGDRTEIGLSQAWAGLDHMIGYDRATTRRKQRCEQISKALDLQGAVLVSRLLARLGFRKAGMTGSALTYDRQPLYRKDPA